jgi:hypothetical protein
VESINENGFYKIALTPEITSKLNNQFFDIRLFNNNTEIPYILHKEPKVNEQELFVEYQITVIEHFKAEKYTRIIIHNPNKTPINNIVLRIKNADVRKRLKLNASYNNQDWYVLQDNYAYNSIYNIENTSEIRVLNFPLSDYEYYELLIDDFFDKPLNITQAGYYNRVKENGKYTQLENISFSIADTLKETLITIPAHGHYIDKITFEIADPKYYYREAELFTNKTNISKKKATHHKDVIERFKLISNSSNTINLDNIKADTLYIRIINNDNVALTLKNINLYQLNTYLIAELKPQISYHLNYSDKKASPPNYDLKYFTDSIPDDLKTISTLKPELISQTKETKEGGNFNIKNYWLWIVVFGVALLLAFMSLKMIQENKEEE